MSFLAIAFAVAAALVDRGVCDKVLVFQGDFQLSNESRAVLYLNPNVVASKAALSRDSLAYGIDLETGVNAEEVTTFVTDGDGISDISVCLWFKIIYYRQTTSYVFSYATSDKDNNELNFGVQHDQMLIAVGGRYVYAGRSASYIPDTWYHMCFVASSQNRTGTFYLNGELHRVRELSPRHILLNGSLVLGQETDKVDGGYQALQSLCGAITGFNLYSRALDPEEVSRLASCSLEAEEGDLVAWTTAGWEIAGPVVTQEVREEKICSRNSFRFVVFSKKRTSEEAKALCHSLKSTVALPRSEEENIALYNAAEPFVDQCQPHNHATAFFFLGGFQHQRGNWTDEKGNQLSYNNSLGRSSRPCSAFKIPKYREEWDIVSCSSIYRFCAACQEEEPVILKMRGLCDSSLHTTFFRIRDQYGEMPLFRGYTKYTIVYDKNGTWSLSDVWTGKTLATFFTHNDEIPFGRRNWLTTTNFDICQKFSNKSHLLSLSACYDWEYSCDDGSCIDLSQRCDLRVDCPDFSDETSCEKLLKPKDYLKALPPPGLQQGAPLQINISVGVQGFSEINIVDMKLVVDFKMEMTWSDSRLRYKNLRHLADLNYIETEQVWIPRVELLNADFPKIYKTDAVLNILRLSKPEKDDPSRISRDEVYKGASNSLRLSQKFNAPFSCAMNMKNFPFDRQHCQLLIRFASAKQEFLEWDGLIARYLGEVMLAEYEVEDISIVKRSDEDYSMAVVGITFCRRYGYYLTSAYLPTIMLMIISYASLFCKRDNCDLRVMMALTTLLVLYALYQQISDDLPRTSYTKAIDVWCFFSITFIFTQVILHVMVSVKVRRSLPFPCLCYARRANEVKVREPAAMIASKHHHHDQPNVAETALMHEITPRMPTDAEVHHPTSASTNVCDEERWHSLVLARIFYVLLFLTFCTIYWVVVLSSE